MRTVLFVEPKAVNDRFFFLFVQSAKKQMTDDSIFFYGQKKNRKGEMTAFVLFIQPKIVK